MDRQRYVEKLKADLDCWNARVEAWEAKYATRLAALREQRDRAAQRLREVQSASAEAWDEVTVGADQAWRELRAAFERARQQFNK